MYDPYIEHSGVKGMHWGVRRYQNYDGSLTSAGRAHYGVGPARKLKSTVSGAIKKVAKGAKSASSRVKTSTAGLLKKMKTKSEERKERNLEKAVSRGNVKNILKGVDRMSDKELNEALNRARNVKALKDLKAPKKSITEKLGDVATTVSKGAVAVQNIAKARNQHLTYKKDKEAYDREEEKRDEEERAAWREAHANDKKLKDILGNMKTRAGEMKKKLDDWEPYDTSESRPPKTSQKAKESLRDRVRRLNEDIEAGRTYEEVREAGRRELPRLIGGPAYTPNYTRRDSNSSPVYSSGRKIAGLLPDLSSPKKTKKNQEDSLFDEIREMTARRSSNGSGSGITADPDEYARKTLKKNKKRLKNQGY